MDWFCGGLPHPRLALLVFAEFCPIDPQPAASTMASAAAAAAAPAASAAAAAAALAATPRDLVAEDAAVAGASHREGSARRPSSGVAQAGARRSSSGVDGAGKRANREAGGSRRSNGGNGSRQGQGAAS